MANDSQVAQLRVPATNLVKYFSELPDAHLLHAAYLEHAPALATCGKLISKRWSVASPCTATVSSCSTLRFSGAS